MALPSPVAHASRPAAFIDPHRQAEYPILLGDSLQDTLGAKNQFFNVQYNWKPKNLSSKHRAVITKASLQSSGDAAYQLTIQEPGVEGNPFKYTGNLRENLTQNGSTGSSSEDQTTSLALVFSQEKSAFILEKISAALDFNLTSAPGQTRADVQAHPQLPSSRKADKSPATVHKPSSSPEDDDDDDDNEEPDAANPYDYRHFLEEAKANAEKGLGGRTPIPGGLSGMPSPIPGASKFRPGGGPDTPLHKPVTSTPSAQAKRRKTSDEEQAPSRAAPRSSTGTVPKNTATKPKAKPTTSTSATSAKPKPLSKERISDSDEEIGDTITLSRPSTSNTLSQSKKHNKPTAATAKSGYAHSPRIEVDEAADLVIDMGSPPPTARRRLGAGFSSPFAIARSQPAKSTTASMPGSGEEEEEDAEGEPDDDMEMPDVNLDRNDTDADGDVEDLVLGSPRASTTRAPSVGMNRMDVDEDEDDELAAELEAALENDDEDAEAGAGSVGLGISTAGGGAGLGAGADDESEVSEEE